MANAKNGGIITAQATNIQAAGTAPVTKQSVGAMLNNLLDQENMRKRFDELLGKRTPQFLSAVVSLVNSDSNLMQAFHDAPITIIQAALKAATFDLPIDPNLGYAYIVPFKNKQPNGSKRTEATFIMGYKGMNQLALRSGVYKKLNVIDVREGELKGYNRLTQEIEFEFVEDDNAREKLPIVGWCGYFQLMNGMEKTLYMTKEQIEAHEQRYRKGQYMGKGWREDFNSMAAKTVFRKLIGKWGVMSIDYQTAATPQAIAAAEAIAKGEFDGEDLPAPAIDMNQPVEETAETVTEETVEGTAETNEQK